MWVLRRVFASKKEKVTGDVKPCIMIKSILRILDQVLYGRTSQEE
jgi:hypothetical protein